MDTKCSGLLRLPCRCLAGQTTKRCPTPGLRHGQPDGRFHAQTKSDPYPARVDDLPWPSSTRFGIQLLSRWSNVTQISTCITSTITTVPLLLPKPRVSLSPNHITEAQKKSTSATLDLSYKNIREINEKLCRSSSHLGGPTQRRILCVFDSLNLNGLYRRFLLETPRTSRVRLRLRRYQECIEVGPRRPLLASLDIHLS